MYNYKQTQLKSVQLQTDTINKVYNYKQTQLTKCTKILFTYVLELGDAIHIVRAIAFGESNTEAAMGK